MIAPIFHKYVEEYLSENVGQVKYVARVYALSEAQEIAKELHEADPEWEYKAVPIEGDISHAYIEAYDEKGNFLGRF